MIFRQNQLGIARILKMDFIAINNHFVFIKIVHYFNSILN